MEAKTGESFQQRNLSTVSGDAQGGVEIRAVKSAWNPAAGGAMPCNGWLLLLPCLLFVAPTPHCKLHEIKNWGTFIFVPSMSVE